MPYNLRVRWRKFPYSRIPGISGASLVTEEQRAVLAASVPENGSLAEIGTFSGTTSRFLADQRPDIRVLGIDSWTFYPVQNSRCAVLNYMGTKSRNLNFFMGGLDQFCRWFPDMRFDVVFLDAMHDYQGCRGMLPLSLMLVKHPGTWYIHDYCKAWPGTVRAVNEFVAARGLTIGRKISEDRTMLEIPIR